jgi:hypothetical protein
MFFLKQQKRKRRKISLLWFTIKHLIIKLCKYCLYLFVLSIIFFFILLKFNENFKTNLLNHPISKKIKQIIKKSCYNLKIEGIVNADIGTIHFHINEYCWAETKVDYSLNVLKNNILKDPWIKIVNIRKELPYSLKIKIMEYTPFALWKDKNELHLINEEGEIIKISKNEQKSFYNLLIIMGQNSKENIQTLFNLLSSNPELASRIKIANKIENRRWNLELDNQITVKFPEDHMILDSWKKLNKLLSMQGIEIGLKTIDLRLDDKIFLEYNAKELNEIEQL